MTGSCFKDTFTLLFCGHWCHQESTISSLYCLFHYLRARLPTALAHCSNSTCIVWKSTHFLILAIIFFSSFFFRLFFFLRLPDFQSTFSPRLFILFNQYLHVFRFLPLISLLLSLPLHRLRAMLKLVDALRGNDSYIIMHIFSSRKNSTFKIAFLLVECCIQFRISTFKKFDYLYPLQREWRHTHKMCYFNMSLCAFSSLSINDNEKITITEINSVDVLRSL